MSKTHFDPYCDGEEAPNFTPCGVAPSGDEYLFASNWQYVDCKRCHRHREKLDAMVASTEAHIIEQMGAFVKTQEHNQ